MSYSVRLIAKDHSDATVHITEDLRITVPGEESMSVDRQNPPHLSLTREPRPGSVPDITCSFGLNINKLHMLSPGRFMEM